MSTNQTAKMYSRPSVLEHQPIRFETAHCWNKGLGHIGQPGNGNGGINYPIDPRNPKKNP